MKLPSYTFYVGNVRLFALLLIFTSVAASISHFLSATLKISKFSSKEIRLLCFFISCSSFFSFILVSGKFSPRRVSALTVVNSIHFFQFKQDGVYN